MQYIPYAPIIAHLLKTGPSKRHQCHCVVSNHPVPCIMIYSADHQSIIPIESQWILVHHTNGTIFSSANASEQGSEHTNHKTIGGLSSCSLSLSLTLIRDLCQLIHVITYQYIIGLYKQLSSDKSYIQRAKNL